MMKTDPTTERIIMEDYQHDDESYLIYLMHLATYKYSLKYLKGKKVLDYGCGSGYGTALISETSSQVIGIDVSPEAINHAKTHFSAHNLSYLQVDRTEKAPLPFPSAFFDVVLSFQVIEHVDDVAVYLSEIHRVLAPGGHILISTPDRSNRLFFFQKPWNIWHVREYTQSQLYDELITRFAETKVLQIGGNQEVIAIELKRTKRLRLLLLPVTLPFIPEFLRRKMLSLIKSINFRLFRRSRSTRLFKPNFDESVFSISDQEKMGIDLLAISRKTSS